MKMIPPLCLGSIWDLNVCIHDLVIWYSEWALKLFNVVGDHRQPKWADSLSPSETPLLLFPFFLFQYLFLIARIVANLCLVALQIFENISFLYFFLYFFY